MVLKELIALITNRLKQTHPDPTEQTQDAWWMLQAITKKSEAELLVAKEVNLSPEQQTQLDTWLKRHIEEHMPLQYLIGSVPFGKLEILVEPPILIPRPETEEWCLNLIELLKPHHQKFTILDIGCGSGCIALALAQAFPLATVHATDVSDKALALSKKNAHANRIKNVTFIKSDVYAQLAHTTKYDLIVSNPPYIAQTEWSSLDPSVTQWEDQRALTAGTDGLDVIRTLIEQAPRWLRPNGVLKSHGIPQLVIEIGYQQASAITPLLAAAGFTNIRIQKDLQGKDRVVYAEF